MKKSTIPSSSSRHLAFDRKLLGYSTAATAALAMAPVPDATAQIRNLTLIYADPSFASVSPPTASVSSNASAHQSQQPLFAGTANPGVVLNFGSLRAQIGAIASVALVNHAGVGIVPRQIYAYVNHGYAANLALGAPIVSQPFDFAGAEIFAKVIANSYGGYAYGGFVTQGTNHNNTFKGYMGFKATGGAHNYYGWLRVQVSRNGDGVSPSIITLIPKDGEPDIYGAIGLAADNITAGEIATAIPEPASVATGLALFALGAVGVREHRRRRSQRPA